MIHAQIAPTDRNNLSISYWSCLAMILHAAFQQQPYTVGWVMNVTTINGAQIYLPWCKKEKAETFMESAFQFSWCPEMMKLGTGKKFLQ